MAQVAVQEAGQVVTHVHQEPVPARAEAAMSAEVVVEAAAVTPTVPAVVEHGQRMPKVGADMAGNGRDLRSARLPAS